MHRCVSLELANPNVAVRPTLGIGHPLVSVAARVAVAADMRADADVKFQ